MNFIIFYNYATNHKLLGWSYTLPTLNWSGLTNNVCWQLQAKLDFPRQLRLILKTPPREMSAERENKFVSSSTVAKCNDSAAILYTQLLSVDSEWPGGGASGGGSIIEAATDCEMLPVNGSAASVLKPFVCQLGCDEERIIEEHTNRREVLATAEVSGDAPFELVIGTAKPLSLRRLN